MQSMVVLVWIVSMLIGAAAYTYYLAMAHGPNAIGDIGLLTVYPATLLAGVAGQVVLFGIAWFLPDPRSPLVSRLKIRVISTTLALIPFGLIGSFLLGMYSTEYGKEILAHAMSHEVPANVTELQTIARDHFELKYPGNWKLASADEFFDIDHYFGIDTAGYSYVLFDINQVDASPEDSVRNTVDYYDKAIRVSGRYLFDTWGKYNGTGIKLVGEFAGEPCIVRIFSYSSVDRSFIVTEFFDVATEPLVQPGFELVESTFELLSSQE